MTKKMISDRCICAVSMSASYLFEHVAAVLLCMTMPVLSIAQGVAPLSPEAAVNGSTVVVTWTRCPYGSTYRDEAVCPYTYAIYRTPALATDPTVERLSGYDLDNGVATWTDTTVLPGTSYNYLICAGSKKAANKSNCSGPTADVGVPVAAPPTPPVDCSSYDALGCQAPGFAPPTAITATVYLDTAVLQWVNPPSNLPVPFIQIDTNQFYQYDWDDVLATLPATGTALPTRFTASAGGGPGTLLPHNTAAFQVCEGIGYVYGYHPNCAESNAVNIGGLDPVLRVTAQSTTSAKLEVTVDNPAHLTSIDVTRQESDDPARQGTTLGNGLKGCLLPSPVAGAVLTCTNSSVIHFVVPANSHSGTFAVGEDSNLKPGVTYYYTASANWFGTMQQSSQVVSFTDTYIISIPPVRGRSLAPVAGASKLQPSIAGQRVPSQAPIKTNAALKADEAAIPARMTVVHPYRPLPGSAADLLGRSQGFCAAGMDDVCANALQMAYSRALMTNDDATVTAVKNALAAQGRTLQSP